jgi:hypothetical protein
MEEYDAESEYGKALRGMSESDRVVAVAKLNKGASDGIKGAVKAKVLSSKYATLCMDKLKEHLLAMRVEDKDMFRKAEPINRARLVIAAAVTVGDWVQVDEDRSPDWLEFGRRHRNGHSVM